MLRGVPVIASAVGGIPEAKLGVDYLLPVRPIKRYQAQLDERMVPLADLPPQDIGPWQGALQRLLSDRPHYDELSRMSRQAALAEAASTSVKPFQNLLHHHLNQSPKPWGAGLSPRGTLAPPSVDHLSPDRRKLLSLRLRRTSAAPPALRLFCFPHAGGGAAAFKDWAERLPKPVAVVPMRTPPQIKIDNMAELVAVLYDSIQPDLDQPFAFFGHSMGAVVAFELARLLRRQNRPLPRLLVASSARAPQFRRGHVPPPEPTEAELVETLRRLQGTPREVLDNPNLMQLILPTLREDAAIYRNYVYAEERPLDFPIRAYGGAEDPNVSRAHLDAWALQTTAGFAVRVFPGGHFYVQTHRLELLAALAQDLST
jgi:medium-chain acyl-[acyl-carrier-protein] hydrolase